MWPLHTGFFCLVVRRLLYAAGFSWLDSSFFVCVLNQIPLSGHTTVYPLTNQRTSCYCCRCSVTQSCPNLTTWTAALRDREAWCEGHLGCSQVLAVMNKVAIQVDIHFQHIWVAWLLSGSCGLGGRGTPPLLSEEDAGWGQQLSGFPNCPSWHCPSALWVGPGACSVPSLRRAPICGGLGRRTEGAPYPWPHLPGI